MSKFKVGDKVFHKVFCKKGEVLYYQGELLGYLVGFKGLKGHSGLYDEVINMELEIEQKGYKDQCWWCSETLLEPVKEDKEMPKINGEIRGPKGLCSDPVGPKPEMVEHPIHYNSCGEYETIKKMELLFGKEAVLTWARLTAFKYRDRLEFKENKEQDTAKMDWYLKYIEENE